MLHLWYHFCWGTVEQTKDHPLCHLKLLRSVQCREQNGSQKIDYQGKLVSLVVNICHQVLLKEEYSQTKNLVGRPGIQLVILNWALKSPYSKVFWLHLRWQKCLSHQEKRLLSSCWLSETYLAMNKYFASVVRSVHWIYNNIHLSESNMRVPSTHEFIRTKIIINVTRRIEV